MLLSLIVKNCTHDILVYSNKPDRQHYEIDDCLEGKLLELPFLLHMHSYNGEFFYSFRFRSFLCFVSY